MRWGAGMNHSTGHPVVDAIGALHLAGNVIHHSWYRHVRYSNKRGEFTDYVAVLILADIVYWYRPVEVRDEQTGHLVGYRKKFAEDKLQRSPAAFSELLCCTEKVARDALAVLEDIGLIDVELRAVKTGFGVVPTAMFIGLNPQRLQEITHNTSIAESIEKSFLPKSVRRNAEMGKKECRNGQGAIPKSVRSDAQMGDSSLYKEFSKDYSENSPLIPQEKNTTAHEGVGSLGASPSPLNQEEDMDKHSSSESKEVITARDNIVIDTQGSAYKMEQRIKERTRVSYPAYRTGPGRNGIKQEFLDWLVSSYLPTTEHYKGKQIDFAQAKCWVLNKEGNGQQELVELRYEQMLSKQVAAQPQQQPTDRAPLTPEQEAWVAIAEQIEMVADNAYAKVSYQSSIWVVTSSIAGMSGRLDTVMNRIPLAALPVKFRTWYPGCYQLAKKKLPHLNLPAPSKPQNRVS